MIDIKPLKPDSARVPSTLEIYRGHETEAKSSRWPVAIMLAITAVAVYLKSLFPGPAKAAFGPPAEPAKGEAGEGPTRQAADDSDEKQPEDETGSVDKEKKPVIGSGGPGPTVGGIADFMGIDSPAIDYEQLPLPRNALMAVDFALGRAGNDNLITASLGGGLLPLQVGGSGGRRDFEDLVQIGNGPKLPVVVGPFPPVIVRPDPNPGPGDDDGDDPVIPQPPVQRNRAPRVSGPVALGEIGICKSFLITAVALLAGASDADADPLSIVNLRVSSGQLVAVEGGWEFKPAAGYYGPVTLTYEISDGEASVTQSASLSVVEFVELIGTSGDDELAGTECADRIDGRDGNDTIDARGGNDIVFGSNGNDVIHGGAGDDRIYGGAGNDIIFGGAGNDSISGGDGNDILSGGDGDDAIDGGNGNDTIDAGAGDDSVKGGDGADVILAAEGNDTVLGEAGNDTIDARGGNDHLSGGPGNDLISAGPGDDLVDGGPGDDSAQGDTGDDIMLAAAGNDRFRGGDGNDRIFGAAGDDELGGDAGDDVMDGGDGDDDIAGGPGNDMLDGGAGRDVVRGGSGDDRVVAALDGDDDCYDGGDGRDTLDLSQAQCDIDINMVEGTAIGIEIGEDKVFDLEAIIGGGGDDHFTVGAQAMTLTGGEGDDTFTFDVSCDDDDRELIHEILDLQTGDRIIISQYQFTTEGNEDPCNDDDAFEHAYGEDCQSSQPFKFRIEKIGDDDWTFVDVYIEQDDEKDFSIEILGAHKLYYTYSH